MLPCVTVVNAAGCWLIVMKVVLLEFLTITVAGLERTGTASFVALTSQK
jgi:hypothetical protein